MSFEVLVNGGKSEQFEPSRGIRQGNPLSSYLFILGQEVLSRILSQDFCNKNINGVKTSKSSPAINHVMYANDIVQFSRATRHEASNILQCIEKYNSWSRQSINWNKSGVFFSIHTQPSIRRAIKHTLSMKSLKMDAIYLEAPLFLSKASSKDFKFLLDKLETKLMGWRSNCLSWAGRGTLIGSMAQAIPTYSMSAFNIPTKICDKLDSISRRFWWKPKSSQGRFIAWIAWEKLCHVIPRVKVDLVSRKQRIST